jgi:hypothetical protein
MKTFFMLFAIAGAMLFATSLSANTMEDQLNGTWSGSFIPASGVRDSMTIEIKHDDRGTLAGRFVSLEATDAASGKQYKVQAKVEGTEIKGTVTAGNESGSIDLIKWTYVPRINGY